MNKGQHIKQLEEDMALRLKHQYKKIDLLDHGFIRLIDWMGSDLSISRNARVSYDAEPREQDEKLINYLYNNGHNTPFEAVTVTFEVKAPIFVFRQWHRHRTQSYNELSARYRELPEEFYIPEPHLVGKQNADNKQMRDPMTEEEYANLPLKEQSVTERMLEVMKAQNETSFWIYKKMIADGVPRELARSVLPVSTYSHMFATVNLNNLFKFLYERTHTHAQYEIRVYAMAMLELIEPIVPIATAAFKENVEWL